MAPVTLPPGTEHGTPAGHEAGCKGDRAGCPAEYTHGMTCTIAYVRERTTPDRYYKARARDPRPEAIARTLGIRPTPRPAQPLAESAQDRRPTEPPAGRVDAPAEGTSTVRDAAGRREAMGHPTTSTKEHTMPTPQPAPTGRRKGHTPPPSASGVLTPAQRQECRQWATDNGHTVSPQGRIAAAIVTAWLDTQTTAPDVATVTVDLDVAHRSELLDETRARLTGPEPEPEPRPEWATVTISQEVDAARKQTHEALALAELHQRQAERARAFGVRLEQEAAEAARVAEVALATVLRMWEATKARADGLDRALAELHQIVADRDQSLAIARGETMFLWEQISKRAVPTAQPATGNTQRTRWWRRRGSAEQPVRGESHLRRALEYVDKSLDNVADLDADLVWHNHEVVEVLEDIRSFLVTGDVTPGTFVVDRRRPDVRAS